MKQKFLMGFLAFATLVGFNFRHALNDYGLAMSSFLMAYASDSSSNGTDNGTDTDGTTGTGTDGTDGTGTDTSTDPLAEKKYLLTQTSVTLECKGVIYDQFEYTEDGGRCCCGSIGVRASGEVELLSGRRGIESVRTNFEYKYIEENVPCRKFSYEPTGGNYTREEAIDCEPTCSRPQKCK